MDKVLFLFGGNSSEHEISCKSIINVIDNIDTFKYLYRIVGITKDGKWIECDKENIVDNSWYDMEEISNIIEYLKRYDVIFPIMHGKGGEDGKLQGLFETFGFNFVGCSSTASMIGMNKYLSKIVFDSIGIPQVPYIKYDNNIDDIDKLGYPLIVKPCNGGSSIGINKVNNKDELIDAINKALEYDNNIIVEKFIKSREFECAVLEDEGLIISDVGEIIYNNDFYDYDDKYINEVKLDIPAKINDELRNKIRKYSKEVFKYINGKGLCRVDYLYDEDNDKLYLNEINTLPGFTDISMYPMLMKEAGYSYKDLISTLIESTKKDA